MRRAPATQTHEIVDTCRDRLLALKPVRSVKVLTLTHDSPTLPDAEWDVRAEFGGCRYLCLVRRGLTAIRLDHLRLQVTHTGRGKPRRRPLILSDYFSPGVAERMISAGLEFVDSAGNIYLDWPGRLYVRLQGQKSPQVVEARPGRLSQASGLQVIFALLADPSAVKMSYRDLARLSGVALGSVPAIMRELKEKRFLDQVGRGEWALMRKPELFDLWVAGYGERLRSKLVIGRFKAPGKGVEEAFDRWQVEAKSAGVDWALTGGFAAYELTRHFKGSSLTMFVSPWRGDLARALRWLPSPQGEITVLRRFSTVAPASPDVEQGTPVAHPLLVYAELLLQGGERELEAAKLVRDQLLPASVD